MSIETLEAYLKLIKRWFWLPILSAGIAGALALTITSTEQPTYQASVRVMVQPGSAASADPSSSLYAASALTRTYQALVTDPSILHRVRDNLVEKYTKVELAATSASASPLQRDGQVLVITATALDPEVARAVAAAFPSVFGSYVTGMQQHKFGDLMQDLENQMNASQSKLKDLAARIGVLAAERGALRQSDPFSDEARLQEQLSMERDALMRLQTSYNDVRIAAIMYQTELVQVGDVSAAALVEVSRTRNLLIAVVIGAILGTVLAGLFELVRDRPDDIREVGLLLELDILGVMPKVAEVTPSVPVDSFRHFRSETREESRMIRTNLRFRSAGGKHKTFLVTSCRPGEGKSYTAASLAEAFAEEGQQTVLVDADLRRPSLHKLFGGSNSYGVVDELAASHPSGGAIESILSRCTPVPLNGQTLNVLFSGSSNNYHAEHFSSSRLHYLMEELIAEADIVLLDGPPILAGADSLILSTVVDGVILVVDPSSPSMREVKQARQLMSQVDAHFSGMILSKVDLNGNDYYYYKYKYVEPA